jgi:hypothetical protein
VIGRRFGDSRGQDRRERGSGVYITVRTMEIHCGDELDAY